MSGSDDSLAGRHRKVVSLSVRLYRKLLLAYPRDFREEYAGEMARYFGELCEDSVRRGGTLALLATWLRTLYEFAVSTRLERKRTIPQREIRPGDAVMSALFLFPGCGQAYNGQPVKAVAHVLGLLGSFIVLGLWFQPSMNYAMALLTSIHVYSALEAWLTARRLKALQACLLLIR